jgi:hypothetical protein
LGRSDLIEGEEGEDERKEMEMVGKWVFRLFLEICSNAKEIYTT